MHGKVERRRLENLPPRAHTVARRYVRPLQRDAVRVDAAVEHGKVAGTREHGKQVVLEVVQPRVQTCIQTFITILQNAHFLINSI